MSTDKLRRQLSEALSEAGAFCGECGFQPGETGCTDCVLIRGMYVDAVLSVVSPQSIPCDRCLCNDCAGTVEQHAGPRCQCYDCASIPEYACTAFQLDEMITLLEEQLRILMSAHLHDRARYRCLVAAHAAFHAIRDHDAATKET